MVTVEDVISAMRERPEVREQVRRAVLTDELLELPERFATLSARVDALAVQTAANTKAIAGLTVQTAANTKAIEELTARFDESSKRAEARFKHIEARLDRVEARLDRVEARLDRVEARLERVEARLERVEARLERVEDQLGILMGDRLERRATTIGPPRISQVLKLRRARIMHSTELLTPHGDEFRDSLEMAEESGKITESDMERLFDTDLILHSRRRTGDRQTLWVAVEASTTIRVKDIARASDSADTLRAAFDEDAAGVVIGHRIRTEDRARADARGLTVILIRLPDRETED